MILKEPIGVVAAITPFNFPLYLNLVKVDAHARGRGTPWCSSPSPLTPLEALALGEIADEAELPRGVLNVVTGGVAESEHLTTHAAVDMVSFTGSNAVGKQIMGQAAQGLEKVLLELGGKSPDITFEGADLDKFAASAATRFTIHAGQGSRSPHQKSLRIATSYDEVVERVTHHSRQDQRGRSDRPKE